jgi:predicted DNA-binding transcriptional regulator AlpA
LQNQNLLTVDELAQMLSVKKSWIYGQTRRTDPDAMPRIVCGKYRRFIYNDVLNWLKEKDKKK